MNSGVQQVGGNALGRLARWVARGAAIAALATGLTAVSAQNFLVNKKFVNQVAPNTQVNDIGPGQTVLLEFNMFNASTGALVGNVTDSLPAGLTGDNTFVPIVTDFAGTVNGNGCSAAGATLNATASTITISNFTFPNTPAAGVNPDCRIYFRVIGNPSALPPGNTNVTNTVPAAQTSATGPGCTPCQSDPFSASLQVRPAIPATLGKSFGSSSIPVNGLTTLVITLTNNAPYPLTGVGLSDTLPAGVVPQNSPAPSTTCTATPAPTVSVAGQTVSMTGGRVPASGSCTVTVTVQGTTGGSFTNTIPVGNVTTNEGVSNTNVASAPITVRSDLTMEKTHDGSPLVVKQQGQLVITRVRFTNYDVAVTSTTLTDNLPAGLVLAANPGFLSYCGGTSTSAAGSSTFTVTGMTIPGANTGTGTPGTCDVYFNTVVTVSSGTITNTIPTTGVVGTTPAGPKSPVAATTATVTAQAATGPGGAPNGGNWGSLGVQKYFNTALGAYVNVDQGAPFWLVLSAINPGYDWRFSNGTLTDVLPLGLQVDVPAVPGGPAYTPVSGTDITYQNWNGSSNAGPNQTGSGSWYAGCANTGQLTVTRAANGQDTITYSGWTIKAMSELATGTGSNWYNSSCWVHLRVKGITPGAYVGGAAPNQPINTIPATTGATATAPDNSPITNANQTTAPVTILSEVGVNKTFNPHVLNGAGTRTTRLTVWLTNKAASPQTNAALTDTLPTSAGWTIVVATPANAATTCTGGTVTAAPGSGSVSIAGATIPAGSIATPGTCSFSVDIAVTSPAGDNGPIWNTIPPGALTTNTPNLTNIVKAEAALYTRQRNVVINKNFGNGGAAQGGQPVPLQIVVTGDAWQMGNLSFTDNLPTGVTVAPNPNISTTCRTIDLAAAPFVWTDTQIFRQSLTPPTITAVAGASSVAVSGIYFPGQSYIDNGMTGQINSCTINVDVVATTTGNKTNTIPAGAVTTDVGATNASPSSATLTVQPATRLVKAFNPTSVSAGTPFTLTFTVFNVNTSPQAGFSVSDTLPANISATSVASNTCGGTVSITGAGSTITLNGATNVGPDASCQFVLNMIGNTVGSYTNNTSNITASAPIIVDTTTTVTVTAPTLFDLTIAKAIDASTPAPYFPGVSQVKFNLTATNNGPGPSQQNIVVKDCLPTGLSYVSATGTGWSCVNNAGPITYGALTCSSEIVCTRNAGGTIASGGSANPIQVTANVTAAASGTLVNYAQVNPAAGETL
ncbi:MAG: DUF11 domain-containing protein, partial [Burkholderiales bacterium]|nr:DUF11 domain-containing protein [Burkholderiales bacterium]